jgi:hypothetical protein
MSQTTDTPVSDEEIGLHPGKPTPEARKKINLRRDDRFTRMPCATADRFLLLARWRKHVVVHPDDHRNEHHPVIE